jgi:isoleucyl-tRNA synthetase
LEKWISELSVNFQQVNELKWNQFKKIKDIVFGELEKLRIEKIINKNTQAKVIINFNNQFDFTSEELKKYLNVAIVEINNNDSKEITCTCSNANYVRCERCWNYFKADEINGECLCERCSEVIKK